MILHWVTLACVAFWLCTMVLSWQADHGKAASRPVVAGYALICLAVAMVLTAVYLGLISRAAGAVY